MEAVEDVFAADGLSLNGRIFDGVDDLLRQRIEYLRERDAPKDTLVFLLNTQGGYVDVVQRVVETIRQHYSTVVFVIPNVAYSAGTVLALSGDAIYMDYYSRLGPIDPQIRTDSGEWVPALGYLKQYERLVTKANEGTITEAEVHLMVEAFDQGALFQYEQARNLSITLLKDWLAKYKFKDWTVTETSHTPVTQEMRERRAEEIGNELNNVERWHIHGRGLSRDVLEIDLGLKVDDFSQDENMRTAVRGYYDLLSDYMLVRGQQGTIHTGDVYIPYM